MSYILEALKKLEKERRRERIPGLTEQDSVVYYSQKRPVWPYLMIAFFVLTAALLVWWLLPNKGKTKDMITSTSAQQGIISNTHLEASYLPQNAEHSEPKMQVSKASVIGKEPHGGSPTTVSPPVRPTGSIATVEVPSSLPHEQAKNTAKLTEAALNQESERQEFKEPQLGKEDVIAEPLPGKKLYSISELPPSVRESLQRFFKITAYMYSKTPSERVVRINDQMMREGQELDPGIKIEEIIPEGVILNYKKFRFIVGVK